MKIINMFNVPYENLITATCPLFVYTAICEDSLVITAEQIRFLLECDVPVIVLLFFNPGILKSDYTKAEQATNLTEISKVPWSFTFIYPGHEYQFKKLHYINYEHGDKYHFELEADLMYILLNIPYLAKKSKVLSLKNVQVDTPYRHTDLDILRRIRQKYS